MSKVKSQVTLHIVVNKNAPSAHKPQQQRTTNNAHNNNNNTQSHQNTNNRTENTRTPTLPIDILHPIYFNQNNNNNNNNNNNTSGESNNTPQNSPTQDEIEDWGRNVHFHGCFFNEDEAQQVAIVFDKKKGADNMMEFTDVHMFLRHYWKWLGSNNHRGTDDKFPMDRLMSVKKQVVGSRKRVTLNEFRQIFFLFDNNSPTHTCPHGAKDRVQRATEELHRSIEPDEVFQNEKFNRMFSTFDKDNDGSLSCSELELFYYMYTLETMQQQTQNEANNNNNNNNNNNKVEKQAQEV